MPDILKLITDAQVASSAIYPTSPYTGKLPAGTVKKESRGDGVKALQRFLNWSIKAGLKIDGYCGKKTVSAIKKFQKRYGLKIDGVFGPSSKAKAKELIKKYAPKKDTDPTPKKESIWDKAEKWCKAVAADDDIHYVWYKDNVKSTKTCPFCTGRIVVQKTKSAIKFVIKCADKYSGGNCIWAAFMAWHHGAKLKNKCKCDVFTNQMYEKMLYNMSAEEALKFAKERTGIKDLKLIRNKNGIPKSQWKRGDIGIQFSGRKYVHTWYRIKDGKIFDSRSLNGKNVSKQIAVRSDKNYTCKMILRYTGSEVA